MCLSESCCCAKSACSWSQATGDIEARRSQPRARARAARIVSSGVAVAAVVALLLLLVDAEHRGASKRFRWCPRTPPGGVPYSLDRCRARRPMRRASGRRRDSSSSIFARRPSAVTPRVARNETGTRVAVTAPTRRHLLLALPPASSRGEAGADRVAWLAEASAAGGSSSTGEWGRAAGGALLSSRHTYHHDAAAHLLTPLAAAAEQPRSSSSPRMLLLASSMTGPPPPPPGPPPPPPPAAAADGQQQQQQRKGGGAEALEATDVAVGASMGGAALVAFVVVRICRGCLRERHERRVAALFDPDVLLLPPGGVAAVRTRSSRRGGEGEVLPMTGGGGGAIGASQQSGGRRAATGGAATAEGLAPAATREADPAPLAAAAVGSASGAAAAAAAGSRWSSMWPGGRDRALSPAAAPKGEGERSAAALPAPPSRRRWWCKTGADSNASKEHTVAPPDGGLPQVAGTRPPLAAGVTAAAEPAPSSAAPEASLATVVVIRPLLPYAGSAAPPDAP